jgi:protocadherin-15
VYVRHVATVPPDQGIGFADNYYTVEVPENATANTLIKTLTIINNRAHQDIIPLKCDIIQGNEEGKEIQQFFYFDSLIMSYV